MYIYMPLYIRYLLCIITFIMFISFLKTVQSFHVLFFTDVFVITWTITYSKKHHNSAELFWVILRLILLEFVYLLRAVKRCLKKVCKDVFCIAIMLTALNFFS